MKKFLFFLLIIQVSLFAFGNKPTTNSPIAMKVSTYLNHDDPRAAQILDNLSPTDAQNVVGNLTQSQYEQAVNNTFTPSTEQINAYGNASSSNALLNPAPYYTPSVAFMTLINHSTDAQLTWLSTSNVGGANNPLLYGFLSNSKTVTQALPGEGVLPNYPKQVPKELTEHVQMPPIEAADTLNYLPFD